MNIKTRLTEFNKTSFGLELETCAHIIGNPLFTRLPMMYNDPRWEETLQLHTKRAVKAIYNCYKHKMPNVRWKLILETSERATRYDQWIIMPDSSLECDYRRGAGLSDDTIIENYCIIDGVKSNRANCQKYIFYPVEIVTPKLTGMVGLKYFTLMWHGVLMGNNLVYSVNDSQGLHTNLSNPRMNPNKFLKLWTQFEYVILQIIGDDRREKSIVMATPLSYSIKTGYPLEEIARGKFVAVSLKKGKSPRLEVRIRSGSMDYNVIIKWTVFCMWLMSISITIPSENLGEGIDYPEFLSIDDKKKLVNNFFKMIYDSTLIDFLQKEYNDNRMPSWPKSDYRGPRGKVLKYLTPKDFSDKTLRTISRMRRNVCPPTVLD